MTIYMRGGDSAPKRLTNKQLSIVCLELCGGGYNQDQVEKAMILQRDIAFNGKVVEVKRGKVMFKVWVEKETDPIEVDCSNNTAPA